MGGILAGLTGLNALSPLLIALFAELRSKDPRTDDEIMAAARAKVAETRTITSEDMTDAP